MTKTIVIVGAGMNIGYSLAQQFGQNGYNVGLIARSEENLTKLASALAGAGAPSVKTVKADVTNLAELESALDSMKAEFGSIDVLEYSPALGFQGYKAIGEVTPEIAEYAFRLLTLGAIAAVNKVLPDMVNRGEGTLLFTLGGAAANPIPFLANVGIASSGLRNYLANLSGHLAGKGVTVGSVIVGGVMKRGTEVDPDKLAELLYGFHTSRESGEKIVLGPPPPGKV
ncbi:SDR family NAD(P)-dependent oxidoreductase [Sinorhizobium meliloti]|uniref:SDR family NAD(P)-dependent oxidoreductase n=1 Tax=Rhizobium meliloti TaxID=382 RepID=UPI003F17F84B